MTGIWTVVFLITAVSCDYPLAGTKPCKERPCQKYEYCSEVNDECWNCSYICDKTNNQDVHLCNLHCLDYILDERYMTKGDFGDQIQKLQVIATISLIFAIVSILCFILAVLWIYKKNKLNIFQINTRIKKKKEKDNLKVDISRKNDLRGEIATIRLPVDTTLNMQEINEIIQNNPRTPQTEITNLTTFKNHHARTDPETPTSAYSTNASTKITPTTNRQPSEDATLEYAYDNPALAPSPVLENGNRNGGGNHT